MSHIKWGLIVGLAAGLLIAFSTFTQFIIVAFFVLIGGVIGWFMQSRIDWDRVFVNSRR